MNVNISEMILFSHTINQQMQKGETKVKVMIGSIILLLIIGFGVWLMLSPLF